MYKIFLEIFNISILATWVILAVLILRKVLKKAPAWSRCALWSVVGLRLVCPFRIHSSLSLIASRYPLGLTQLYRSQPQLNSGIDALDEVVNPVFSQAFGWEGSPDLTPLRAFMTIGGWVWLTGVVVLLGYMAVSYLWTCRNLRLSAPLEDHVYQCDTVQTPFILGILKPRVYLPSVMKQEEYIHILAHERAHIRRKDYWWKPLGFAILAVYWFNPLVWLAYVLLCRDMEQAADERVIDGFSVEERKAYSETLLRYSVPRSSLRGCPLAFGEVGVKQRIKSVLAYRKPAKWIVITATVLCLLAVICFTTEPWPITNPTDIAGKSFGQGEYAFGTSIYFWEDGVYNCTPFGLLSSTIDVGHWEIEGKVLHLWKVQEVFSAEDGKAYHMVTRHYYFTITKRGLVFRAAESDLLYGVEDGELLTCYDK
jgi:beta-lactamase regulating signal transducer with metallopeptidase domain